MVAARPKTALPYRRLSTAYRGRVPRARVTHRSAGTIERTLSTSKGARVTVFGKCRGDKSKPYGKVVPSGMTPANLKAAIPSS
jgi:hypothetical protein